MLRVLRQSHAGPDHCLDRLVETIKDPFTIAKIEDALEDSKARPEEIERASVTEILHAFHYPSIGRFHLSIKLISKSKLTNNVNAEPLTSWRHINHL